MSDVIIKNKICIITGGASGIGLATAYDFLKNQAAAVVIADINEVNGERAVNYLEHEFGPKRSFFRKTDVTISTDLESSRHAAVVNSTNIAIKYLKSDGVIVNISSILGVSITPFFPIYTATKHAVIAFTTSMSKRPSIQKLNIKLLTICPGFTDTQLGTNCYKNDSEDMLELIQKTLQNIPLQKPEFVAENITMVIEKGSSGSVWVVENQEPAYEIDGNKLLKMSSNY